MYSVWEDGHLCNIIQDYEKRIADLERRVNKLENPEIKQVRTQDSLRDRIKGIEND